MIQVGVVTVSDKGSGGEREDLSGKVIREIMAGVDATVAFDTVIPDEKEEIRRVLIFGADEMGLRSNKPL